MKKLLLIVGLLSCGWSATAQKISAKELAERNEQLEYLLLDYKEQLLMANAKIELLTRQNNELKQKINSLLMKDKKTDADIDMLKEERKTLLMNNEILKQTIEESKRTANLLSSKNQELNLDNRLLKNANKLLEDAAIASDTIQKYQELKIAEQREAIAKIALRAAERCARLTGAYKMQLSSNRVNVALGKGESPAPKDLEDLTIEACYQLRGEVVQERILVYFQLYDKEKREVVRGAAFPLIKEFTENEINYFEGQLTLPTDGSLQLDRAAYFYEVRYLEQVIASGQL